VVAAREPLLAVLLRHASNRLDNVDLVQAQHCQAESLTFDACLRRTDCFVPDCSLAAKIGLFGMSVKYSLLLVLFLEPMPPPFRLPLHCRY
jgi:hypothetical protein